MDNILVDNWFMEDVVADIRDGTLKTSKPFSELLMLIMFWDNVCYPRNDYNWWNTIPTQVKDCLTAIDDQKDEGKDWPLKLECYLDGYTEAEYNLIRWKDSQIIDADIVSAGALRYMRLSHMNSCDYLPCERRRQYLQSILPSGRKMLSRIECENRIETEIKALYTETYKELSELIPNPKIDIPLLLNYVLNTAPLNFTAIEYAFHLKNEGAVVRYREYLRSLSECIEKNDVKELKRLIDCSKDVASDVDKPSLDLIDFKGNVSDKENAPIINITSNKDVNSE